MASDDNTIQASVAGGLNTVSSALQMPPEDSPEMNNTYVTFSGNITKRAGLGHVKDGFDSTDPRYIKTVAHSLRIGEDVLISKAGTKLVISHLDDTTWREVIKTGVWSDEAEDVKPDIVVSNEPLSTRILFFTGINIPVQLRILEASIVATAATTTTVTLEVGTNWEYVTNTACMMWVDGTWNTVAGVSYSGGSVTFTLTDAITVASHEFKVAFFSWQWWAEAMVVRGEQIIGQTAQSASQTHVATPASLLEAIHEVSERRYPIKIYQNTNFDTLYTNAAGGSGSSTAYNWSLGVDSAIVPSPSWVTFGTSPGSARGLLYARSLRLPFYGGDGGYHDGTTIERISVYNIFSTNIWVLYNTAPSSEGGSGTGGAKWSFWFRHGTSFNVSTSAGRKHYIGFDATSTANGGIAIPADDIYVVADTYETPHVDLHIGSNAKGSATTSGVRADLFRDGYPYAVAGLSEVADYKIGSFPRTGCIWQGRLVVGGFPYNPMALAASAKFDYAIPGEYFNDFQTDFSEVSGSSAFTYNIASVGDDTITAVREFQGQLFIWSRYRAIRIAADASASGVNHNTLAQIGCVNSSSVAITDRTVLFLSQSGVFAISPTDRADAYTVTEVSVKIRNKLAEERPSLEITGWLSFDVVNSDLYVGVSSEKVTDYTDELFVFNTLRNTWTRFTDPGGIAFRATFGFVEYPTSTQSNVYFITWKEPTGAVGSVLKMDEDLVMDCVHYQQTWSGSDATVTVAGIAKVSEFTTTNNKVEYDPGVSVLGRLAFRPSTILDYTDVYVTLDGTELEFNEDYYKTERGTIVLATNPLTGSTLVVEPRMNWAGSQYRPVAVRVDGEYISPDQYTVAINGSDQYTVQFDQGYVPDAGAVIDMGVVYPAKYFSPVFTRGSIVNAKRLTHFAGYFNNEAAGDYWTEDEVGTRYDLIGTNRKKINMDLILLFNSLTSGTTDYEMYGSSDLQWDEADLELGVPPEQYQPYTRTVIPIIGTGYSFQAAIFCYAPTTFQLAGYQITAILKKGRTIK